MPDRTLHQEEVRNFLQNQFLEPAWEFTLPPGSGNETYFARSGGLRCFVKLGAPVARYQAVAAVGLTPPVLAKGSLSDGTTILVQAYISGKTPSRKDYRERLEAFALAIRKLHHSPVVIQALPRVSADLYRVRGIEALDRIQEKWVRVRPQVLRSASFVDESLAALRSQILEFEGSGLVASHNDLCNANWLVADEGRLYILDLDAMALDDPALDLGATLWWYIPPGLRGKFLTAAGCGNEPAFHNRMRVRMALHCLDILLPRAGSFDRFSAGSFDEALTDFKAAYLGQENPQGYD